MKQIAVKAITLNDFKSFRESTGTTIDLPTEGFTLIAGDNRAEPRLGANGAGKSTLFDALCWCLYGTSVRGVRTADLVAVGEKSTHVTVELEIDGKTYGVTRTGPPARIFINDQPAEQDDVERLVGLSRVRFLNSVVFGQAVPLFIDLPRPRRGELLDEVLDLELWMRAADRAGKEHTDANKRLSACRVEIGRTEGAVGQLADAEELAAQEREWAESHAARLDEMLEQFEAAELALTELQNQPAVEVPPLDELWAKYQALKDEEAVVQKETARLEQRHATVLEDINFFKGAGDICPVCTQTITREFADQHLEEQRGASKSLTEELRRLGRNFADLRAATNEAHMAWSNANAQAISARARNAVRTAAIPPATAALANMEKQIEAHGAQVNPYTGQRERLEKDRAALEAKLAAQRQEEESLSTQAAQYEFWRQGFRRVRLFCIRRVLQQLELETMNAANQLGLVGWKISFATETETRSGTTTTGVQVVVESPALSGQFDAWSGGEGQRVRLCVALGLAGLIQRWSGVRWNLEVFDEPTAWLSEAGIEDLLELLRERADISGRSIFLADHRALTFAGFSRVITVVKDEDGSRIQ